MEYSIIRLTDRPELKAQSAAWFHAKWGVPEQAYLDSMAAVLRETGFSGRHPSSFRRSRSA